MVQVEGGGGKEALGSLAESESFFSLSLSAAAGSLNIVRGKGGRDAFSGPPPSPSPFFRRPLVSVRSFVLAARVLRSWNTSSRVWTELRQRYADTFY